MNGSEQHFEFGHEGPHAALMLEWLHQFQFSASPFVLVRTVDHNGQSGTGIIADGVVFPDGRVNIRWRSGVSGVSQTENWDELSHAMRIHGHGGDTVAVMIPVAALVGALEKTLLVNGMMEVSNDPAANAYAEGWNACRKQIEYVTSRELRPYFEPTVGQLEGT